MEFIVKHKNNLFGGYIKQITKSLYLSIKISIVPSIRILVNKELTSRLDIYQ